MGISLKYDLKIWADKRKTQNELECKRITKIINSQLHPINVTLSNLINLVRLNNDKLSVLKDKDLLNENDDFKAAKKTNAASH